MLDIEEFLSKGYYVGKVNELIDNGTLLKRYTKNLLDLSQTKENYVYVYGVNKPVGDGIPDLPPGSLKEHQVKERDEYVQKYNANVYQKWWIFDPNSDLTFSLKIFLQKYVEDLVTQIYPDLKNNIYHNDSITLYEEGDFCGYHADGKTPGRKCVILLYLTDESSYNDGGGELNIKKDGVILSSTLPTNLNYCLMDCSLHDLEHEVAKVKNGFKRYTYVNFIYNKTELEEEKNKQNDK